MCENNKLTKLNGCKNSYEANIYWVASVFWGNAKLNGFTVCDHFIGGEGGVHSSKKWSSPMKISGFSDGMSSELFVQLAKTVDDNK